MGSPWPTQLRNSCRPLTSKRPAWAPDVARGSAGAVVERDAFDAVRWLGFDLEEECCFFSGTGSNDGDGGFGPGVEGEPCEVDAAAFGDRLAEECDHGLRRQDVA